MLLTLNIENVAVIESANIDFTDGFNVLTGETGAGKSIVIDSINTILGERTYKDIIRSGCEYAIITAEFNVSKDIAKLVEELGYSCFDGTLLLQRKLSCDGKNIVRINGKPATVGILREIGIHLINIHGQHDSQNLLNPDSHLYFIDALAENESIYSEYITSYRKLVDVKHQIQHISESNDDNAQLQEMLEYQINELASAEISVGEKERLTNRRNIIKNTEKIKECIALSRNSLIGDDDASGITDKLHICAENFEELSSVDERFKAFSERFYSLEIDCRDLAETISNQYSELDYDAAELNSIEQRLDLLYSLSLKYGDSEEKMLDFLNNAKEKLNSIVNYDKHISELEIKFTQLLSETKAIAEELTESRFAAANKFETAVCEQLRFLDMPYVVFSVSINKTKLTARGAENVEFLISTNPGEPPKPLAKIASGGELSRIMLAIKSVLSRADTVPTLIFDEIDAGISGSAAQKVGQKIRSISKDKQVICVTHLAQIAAMANTHFLITKNIDGKKSYTHINRLSREERVSEIARIISGGEITDNLRVTAEEMLNKALTY